jgi:hypothetical protein
MQAGSFSHKDKLLRVLNLLVRHPLAFSPNDALQLGRHPSHQLVDGALLHLTPSSPVGYMPTISAFGLGPPHGPSKSTPHVLNNVQVPALSCAVSDDGQTQQLSGLLGNVGCVLGGMVLNDEVVTIRVAGVQVGLQLPHHLDVAQSSVGLACDDEPMQALQPLLGLVAGITVACMATRIIFLQRLELEGTAKKGLVGIFGAKLQALRQTCLASYGCDLEVRGQRSAVHALHLGVPFV